MEPPHIPTAEAERWLSIALRLLAGRDLVGSKTFAIRARDCEPGRDIADQILAIADTLIAGEKRVNDQHDWYAILQLPGQTHDSGLIAAHYRQLAILLNPHRNHLPFADEAFKLVYDAWSVLFDPTKKSIYDSDLAFPAAMSRGQENHEPQQYHYRQQEEQQQNAARESPRNIASDNERNATEEPELADKQDADSTFWTTCPYCYYMYEYPRVYEDCSLRCQKCERAFHGAKIPVPPQIVQEKETSFSCWGFFPVGVSNLEKSKSAVSNWTPFSPMYTCPKFRKKVKRTWIYIDDDDIFRDIPSPSEESDDEWGRNRRKKKAKKLKLTRSVGNKFTNSHREKARNVKGASGGALKGGTVTKNFLGSPSVSSAGTSRKAGASSGKKKVPKELGKLDLNVEFSNEVEEPAPGMREGNKAGNGEEDGIEGIGFFEGLDEFLSSLPILKG